MLGHDRTTRPVIHEPHKIRPQGFAFGTWRVVKYLGYMKYATASHHKYLVACTSCGVEKEAYYNDLRRPTSCACLRPEARQLLRIREDDGTISELTLEALAKRLGVTLYTVRLRYRRLKRVSPDILREEFLLPKRVQRIDGLTVQEWAEKKHAEHPALRAAWAWKQQFHKAKEILKKENIDVPSDVEEAWLFGKLAEVRAAKKHTAPVFVPAQS